MGISKMSNSGSLEEEVLELLAKVPSPPNEEASPGATERDIAGCEARIGLNVPTKLRAWLLACNGPCVGPGGVFGIRPRRQDLDIEQILTLHPIWHEKGWIPIAGDGCGNYYVVASKGEFGKGEPVIFIDTMDDDAVPAYIVASEVWRFLRFLLKKELGESKWPYNRDEVAVADPDILSFEDVTLPWNA
jgi:cell wall assembly regulator SMI1